MTTYSELFRIREFRALFVNTTVGVAGGVMRMLAVSALVYATTGSALLAALAYLGGLLPQAIGAITLMSLADRLPPRAALVVWRLVHASVATILALGFLPVWAMLSMLLLVGLGDAVVGAIGSSIVVDVVPQGSYILGRSTLNIAVGSMQILGYAVAGTLLTLTGPSGALWLSAGLALVSTAIVRFGLRKRPPRATGRGTLALTWAGNRVLFGDPTTRRLLLGQWLPNGLIVGAEAMYVPYIGNGAGVMFAGAAAGMLAGDIVIGRWTSARLRSVLALPLYTLLAVPYLAFLLRPGLVVATALVVVASFGYAGTLVLQERFVAAVPEQLLGQGMGLASSGMLTGQAVCAAIAGSVAEFTSPAAAMTIVAAASLVTTVVLLGPQWPRAAAATTAKAEAEAEAEATS